MQCVLREPEQRTIAASSPITLTKNLKGVELELDTGEIIAITHRKKINLRQLRYKRVLSVSREWAWLKHDLIDDFNKPRTSVQSRAFRNKISRDWRSSFAFRQEGKGQDEVGLRPPQIGALHAIGAHWSLSSESATIVMPTGTGKTETMIGAFVHFCENPVLVVVPSIALREQLAKKFLTLGLMRTLKCLPADVRMPIVGTITGRPRDESDLTIFDQCNIVISTMSSLSSGTAARFHSKIAGRCSALFVDEAHHIPAETWATFRERFSEKKILQFTATPYRRDAKTVEGKCIYSYSLAQAQKDGYFKPINFETVNEGVDVAADSAIAEKAVAKLTKDLDAGFDHVLMARCRTISRATDVHKLYLSLAPEHHPILLHSKGNKRTGIDDLRGGRSRVVVCVDMLGEGFDLPQLKIAALHDPHKSLAVLLQFTGRFTRTAGLSIGDATIVANIGNQPTNDALDRLFQEDSDWDVLLSGYSGQATQEYRELNEFLANCERLDRNEKEAGEAEISSHSLIPRFSSVLFKTDRFVPEAFHKALSKGAVLGRAWLNRPVGVLIFVTREELRPEWCRSRSILDREWHLYIAHFNERLGLLFIHSSNKASWHLELAMALTKDTARPIKGDTVFRSLDGIKRLMLQNVGLKKPAKRNINFSLFTGADVANGLSLAQKMSSVKSNVFGNGYAGGAPTTVGCSIKGRIWSREAGQLPYFLKWCERVGEKVVDESISTEKIIDNVLVPEEVTEFPAGDVLVMEWPVEFLERSEHEVHIVADSTEVDLSDVSLSFDREGPSKGNLRFFVHHVSFISAFSLHIGGPVGYSVRWLEGPKLLLRLGRRTVPLEEWMSECPPRLIFVDGSELDGNLLMKPQAAERVVFPSENIEALRWRGIDLSKESIWKKGVKRENSIQFHMYQKLKREKFDVIFDDDGPGEAADLVCIKDSLTHLSLKLVHCKFSGSAKPGERVKDLIEVCCQAVRSRSWHWRFWELCKHLAAREAKCAGSPRTRFLHGDLRRVRELQYLSKQKPLKTEIVVVQPGALQNRLTSDQIEVLSAAHSYLLETIEVPLRLICSLATTRERRVSEELVEADL